MIHGDQGTVARKQAQLMAYHRSGSVPNAGDVSTLWEAVKHFPMDVFDRAMRDLQSPQWKGEYPPDPKDIVEKCNIIVRADEQIQRATEAAEKRPSHLLEGDVDDGAASDTGNAIAQRIKELVAQGVPTSKASIQAFQEQHCL